MLALLAQPWNDELVWPARDPNTSATVYQVTFSYGRSTVEMYCDGGGVVKSVS